MLLKLLDNLPSLDDTSFHFELSRRESLQSNTNIGGDEDLNLEPPALNFNDSVESPVFKIPKNLESSKPKPKMQDNWIKGLKESHKKFKFSTEVPAHMKKPANKMSADFRPLYEDEKNAVCKLLKQITYAEGDHICQSPQSIAFIKTQIKAIVSLFTLEPEKGEKKGDSAPAKKEFVKKRDQKLKSKMKKKQKEDSNYTESEADGSDASEEEYKSDRDKIKTTEITDSSCSEPDSALEEEEGEGRTINFTLLFYVFRNVVLHYFKLKKKAKEARKQMK